MPFDTLAGLKVRKKYFYAYIDIWVVSIQSFTRTPYKDWENRKSKAKKKEKEGINWMREMTWNLS